MPEPFTNSFTVCVPMSPRSKVWFTLFRLSTTDILIISSSSICVASIPIYANPSSLNGISFLSEKYSCTKLYPISETPKNLIV